MRDEDVVRANALLREMFEGFYVSRRGERVVVDPRPHPGWMPQGRWTRLDFGEDDAAGIEIVEFLGEEIRRVSLVDGASNPPVDSSIDPFGAALAFEVARARRPDARACPDQAESATPPEMLVGRRHPRSLNDPQ